MRATQIRFWPSAPSEVYRVVVETVCLANNIKNGGPGDTRRGIELSTVTFDHDGIHKLEQRQDSVMTGRSKGISFSSGYVADVAIFEEVNGTEWSQRPEYGLEGIVCDFELRKPINGKFLLSGHRYVIVRWPKVSGTFGSDRIVDDSHFARHFNLAATSEASFGTVLDDGMRQYLQHVYDTIAPLTLIGDGYRMSLHVWTEGNAYHYHEARSNMRETACGIAERVCLPLEFIARLPE